MTKKEYEDNAWWEHGYYPELKNRKSSRSEWATDVSPHVTDNQNVPLHTDPHYTDERYNHAQTVYGRQDKSLYYDYSDRLWQWDYQKAERSMAIAGKSGFPAKSLKYYEVYLSAYFDKPIEILHIMAGVNVSSGYSYATFGYRDKK